MAAAVVLPVGGGLTLALLLHEGVWGANFYKSLFYLPICLSLAVIGQVWIWIYQPDWGLINTVLRWIQFRSTYNSMVGKHKNCFGISHYRLVMAANRPGNGNFPGWINIHSF